MIIDPDVLLHIFTIEGLSQIMRWLVVITEITYLFFAIILVREISLMNKTFKTNAASLFTLIGFTHLLITLGVVLISIAILTV